MDWAGYSQEYVSVYVCVCMQKQLKKEEAMNLKASKEKHIGEFEGGKRTEGCCNYINLQNQNKTTLPKESTKDC